MKQKKQRICTILAICFVGVLLGELYLFKTYPNSIYIVAAGMAVLLILTYFLSSNLIDLHNEWIEEKSAKQEELLNRLITELSNNKEDHTQETLANMEKFEKAIYVAIQQHTTKMQESISQLDQGIAGDFDRLQSLLEETTTSLTEQIKSTVEHSEKVYVKFSRENAKSLMMFQKKAFDNVMLGMEETVQESTKSSEKTQAKLDELKQTLSHLNVQVQATSDMIPTVTEDETIPEVAMESIVSQEEETVIPEEIIPDVPQKETIEDTAETMAEEIPATEETPTVEDSPADELPVIEDIPVAEPAPVNDDPNHVMTPEEIAALVAGSSEPVVEEIPAVDEAPVAEPSPVNDDPNHVMTPEEIAALIAGTSEPAAEEIPFVDDTPVQAEPTPVNDDPNHIMTPEEIAALIAGNQ